MFFFESEDFSDGLAIPQDEKKKHSAERPLDTIGGKE